MKKIILIFFLILCSCTAYADEYILNLISDGNLNYYENEGCAQDPQLFVKEDRGRLLLIQYEVDRDSGKPTNQLELGCELERRSGENSDFANFNGRCKFRPPPSCPTCNSSLINLFFSKVGNKMIILSLSEMKLELSGVYMICKKQ